jgi:hypothetical protein
MQMLTRATAGEHGFGKTEVRRPRWRGAASWGSANAFLRAPLSSAPGAYDRQEKPLAEGVLCALLADLDREAAQVTSATARAVQHERKLTDDERRSRNERHSAVLSELESPGEPEQRTRRAAAPTSTPNSGDMEPKDFY